MIDRTQLTEALDWFDKPHGWNYLTDEQREAIVEAAQWARDFPTDQQVEAAARVHHLASARRVLEAVRDTMIDRRPPDDRRDRDWQ